MRGFLETHFPEPQWQPSRGYRIATEAATAIRDGLALTGISSFSAIASPNNAGSIAVMKKLGMAFSHTQFYEDSVFSENVVVYTQHLR